MPEPTKAQGVATEELHRIVLIDSNPTNLTLLEGMLRRLDNVESVSFTDPVKALKWCEENQADLVFVDYSLPLMDGIEFIGKFRDLQNAAQVPVVMISSLYDQDILYRALEGGANDFLTKPIDRYELLARTRNMLALRDSQVKLSNQAALLSEEVEKATADLKTSEERYALAARGANDGLWDWDIVNDKVYYSHRWKSMLGYNDDEITDSLDEWFGRVHPSDIDQLQVDIAAHLEGKSEHFESEFRIRHKDKSYRWILSRGLAVRDDQGNATRFVGSQTDMTVRKTAEQRLVHDAFHDNLTGLPNRALFLDRMKQALTRQDHFAVLFMDMDRFKYVNDTMGHKGGDELLIILARRLENCCRAGDTVARFGGDEFTILLNNIQDLHEVEQFADRLLAEVGEPISIEEQEIFPTLSIGIALSSEGLYDRPEEMIRDADIAMYRAKENGKGCYIAFSKEMRDQAVTVFKLEANLRRAIEREEIVLYYQPIIDLQSGRIAGFEALMRWEHPSHGLIHPDEFVPLAEETNLILQLGKWALHEACNQVCEWNKQFQKKGEDLFITVNVSVKQLESKDFVDELLPLLNKSAIESALLKLEVTESIILANPDKAEQLFFAIKELGISLAIDDFGTGYSSLSYLHRYPFDTLKIDRMFIERMLENEKLLETVRIINLLADSLGMSVVAEGVEKEEQVKKLRELKCMYGQGFYFSRPRPAKEISDILAKKPKW